MSDRDQSDNPDDTNASTSTESDPRINQVLDFWFGEIVDEMTKTPRSELWFGGGAEVDQNIKEKFESVLLLAATGELDTWKSTARGTLALIILLDQFPLNIYRKTARAFDFEQQAIAICKEGLQRNFDQQLHLVERSFFYMPLEHSENLEDQNLSVACFESLHKAAADRHQGFTSETLKYANEHQQTIAKYGRFPYRNDVLGRTSSAEELSYLDSGGKRYGQ